jgi:hypothetical protein
MGKSEGKYSSSFPSSDFVFFVVEWVYRPDRAAAANGLRNRVKFL